MTQSRVLVLEDDQGIRRALGLGLEDEGYSSCEAATGEDALALLRSERIDVLLVDLTLAGAIDGFEFIRQARELTDAPIVVVSARADTHDIVAALEAGADDYVTKPFQIKEIGARVRALRRRDRMIAGGRRDPEEPQAVVLDGQGERPLVLMPDAGIVRRGSDEVHLTLTEYRLLCELAARPGTVLTRRTLLESVWEHGFFGDERLVDVHVRRLRTKVEEDPSAPRTIVTVRGLGYRLDLR